MCILLAGEYVLKIQDATTPPFMDVQIEPVFIMLKVVAPKKPPKVKKTKDKGPKYVIIILFILLIM